MPVEDIFTIQGRGTVATGESRARQGESERDGGSSGHPADHQRPVVTGVEMFKKLLDEGTAGDNVGLLLRGVERKDIERGQVISKPGSITPHTKFKAGSVRIDEGRGRATHAVLYRVPAAVLLPDDGRDRGGAPAGGSGDGDAGRQRADGD